MRECRLSPLFLLITGQRLDKACLLGNGVGEEEQEVVGGWGHLMTGQEEEEGRGEAVSVSRTLLVLIGVLRKGV